MSSRQRALLLGSTLLLVLTVLLLWRGRAPNEPAPSAPATPAARASSSPASTQPPERRAEPLRLTSVSVQQDAAADSGVFEGTVRSARDGSPVAGGEVVLAMGGAAFTTPVERGGHFTFKPGHAGTYQLQAVTAPGFLPYAAEWGHGPITLTATPGARVRDLDIYLTPAVEYLGRVVDSSDKPVAGAEIRLLDAPGDALAGLSLAERHSSDARGEFHFQAPDGTLLEASHPDFLPGRARVDLAARAAREVTLRLGQKKPGEAPPAREHISGIVMDPSGAPLEGALVSAEPVGDAALQGPARREQSGADGRFTLGELDPGTYTLTASAPSFVPARRFGVHAGDAQVELRLGTGARLTGTVLDARSGEPIPSFTVQVSRRNGLGRDELVTRAFIDPRGHYALQVPPGELAVVVAAYGYAPSDEALVTVAPETPARADARLSRGGRIHGKVVDEKTRVPLAGAHLSVEGRLGSAASAIPVEVNAVTGAQGEFSLEGLAAGLGSVTVAAEGHHTRILSGLDVRDDGTIGPLTVELAPTAEGEEPRIELVGIGAVLTPQENALVVVRTLPGGGAAEAGLAAGDTVLRVEARDVGVLGFSGAVQHIRGAEGSTVELTVKRAADGQVLEVPVVRRRIRG